MLGVAAFCSRTFDTTDQVNECVREWRTQHSSQWCSSLVSASNATSFHVPNYNVPSLPLVCSMVTTPEPSQLALIRHLLCCDLDGVHMFSLSQPILITETHHSHFTSSLETSSNVPKVTSDRGTPRSWGLPLKQCAKFSPASSSSPAICLIPFLEKY